MSVFMSSVVAAVIMAVIVSIIMTIRPVPIIVFLAISRRIGIAIPVIIHKIHWAATGVISTAIVPPIFVVARWNVQIQRRINDASRYRLNNHGRTIHDRWSGYITYINLTIITRLTNVNRQPHICSCRCQQWRCQQRN